MGKGLSITGFVLALVALVASFWQFPFAGIAYLAAAIVGLVLSVVGGKKLKANGQKHGLATAGMIIGIIATVFTAINFFACGLVITCGACAL